MADQALGEPLHHVRSLHRLWVKEHGAWIFVWSCDNGELDMNLRLAYAVVSSPAEFNPAQGSYILASNAKAYSYVYGVPYSIESSNGAVKVWYQDLGPALEWPRQATGEKSPDSSLNGKSMHVGVCIEGNWSQEDITDGPILWTVKNMLLHNNPGHVLEVTDIADVDSFKNLSAPTGTLLMQYQRDGAGRIKVDTKGIPLIARIHEDSFYSDSNGWKAQNFKIGYLALQFVEDYFGTGMHGWIGASSSITLPWTVTLVQNQDKTYSITVYPGSLNQLLPSNIFDNVKVGTINDSDVYYVKLSCNTDGKAITAIEITVDKTPVDYTSVVAENTSPSKLLIILAVLSGTAVYQIQSKNLTAVPVVAFLASKIPDAAGQEPYTRWWQWSVLS